VTAEFRDEWLSATLEELVGAEKLAEVREAKNARDSLWETAVAEKVTADEELLSALSRRFRLKLADVTHCERSALDAVPQEAARQYHILPLRITNSWLEIASSNPFDLDCEKTLAFATGREVRVVLASPASIDRKIDEMYHPENVLEQLIEGMGGGAEITQLDDTPELTDELSISAEEASQRPVVRLVDLIFSEGILARASDIHIEPEEGGIAVRFRIDGVLREHMKIPRAAGLPLISRT